jgi:hypothetical protein
MGFLIVRLSPDGDPEASGAFVIAMSDSDTPHDYFREYLVDGWTREILHYLPSDTPIDNWDYAHTLVKRESQAHGMREGQNGRDDLPLD